MASPSTERFAIELSFRQRDGTDEKVVFVSHYTSSLNILSAYCDRKRYKYNRLDG